MEKAHYEYLDRLKGFAILFPLIINFWKAVLLCHTLPLLLSSVSI